MASGILSLAVGGCGTAVNDPAGDAQSAGVTSGSAGAVGGASTTGSPTGGGGSGGTDCEVQVDGPLQGVSLRVWGETCRVPYAVGGTFDYEVTIGPGVPTLHTPMEYGKCFPWSSDPLSFVAYSVSGNGQSYCFCDAGKCAPPDAGEWTLAPGSYAGSFDWPGVNWDGPSDFGQPYDPPFPRGDYVVHVDFVGALEGSVLAELPIVVE